MGTASVDNFWLLTAMRYGLPAFLLLVAGIAANLVQIVRQPGLGERLADLRRGHVIATIGLAMTLGTVHAWGADPRLRHVLFRRRLLDLHRDAFPRDGRSGIRDTGAGSSPDAGPDDGAEAGGPDPGERRRAPGRRQAPAPPRPVASGADPPKPSAWRAGAHSIRAAAAPTARAAGTGRGNEDAYA